MIRHRRALGSLATVLAFGVLLPASAAVVEPEGAAVHPATETVDPGEAVYRSLTGLPVGAGEAGAGGVERSAIALAATLRAVPLAEGSTEACPEDRLAVSWEEPGPSYGHGALVEPLGPAPGPTTAEVNGVVVCTGAPWAFMGFEARYVGKRWDVVAVPFVDEHVEDHDDHGGHDVAHGSDDDHAHEAEAAAAVHAHAAPSAEAPPAVPAALSFGGPIEGYARYEPQRTCSPTAKPGTLAMQRFLMEGAPGSRNLGISRGCSIGGSSEHKEGRAFDWGVLVTRPAERAAAEDFLARLLATDAAGNRHALARRMGVMYVIWNRQIWSAYRAEDGWRPYSGRSPHTDHVHISLSWDGALGRTSFWSGQPVEGVSFATQPIQTATGSAPAPAPARSAPAPTAMPAPAPTEAPRREPKADEDARRAQQAAEELARRQQKAAEEEARRQQKAAEQEAHRQQKAAEHAARQQQKAAEEQARRQEEAAREEARRRDQAAKEQERQVRQASAPGPPAHAGGPPAGDGGGPGKGKGRGKGG